MKCVLDTKGGKFEDTKPKNALMHDLFFRAYITEQITIDLSNQD